MGMQDDTPLIETVPIFDVYADGICRLDRIGTNCSILYFAYRIEPEINGGRVFRTPVIRQGRSLESIRRHGGVLQAWLRSGPPEGSHLVPASAAVPVRELN